VSSTVFATTSVTSMTTSVRPMRMKRGHRRSHCNGQSIGSAIKSSRVGIVARFVFGGVTGTPLSPVVTHELLQFEP
jgi:hypothetical protein